MTLYTDPFERLVHRIDPQARLLRAWPLTGGVSAQVTALEIERADGTTHKMILRRHGDIDFNANPRIAADEFRLLQILRAGGLPTPSPYYLDAQAEFFPRPSLVMEFIDGETLFTPLNPSLFARQMAATLHQIHLLEGALTDLAFLPTQTDIISQKLANQPERVDDSIGEGRIRDVLERAWPFPRRNPPALLHGDYWPGNILWRDGMIVGVIDWEDARLGDPLGDLGSARLEMLWTLGGEAMQVFTDHYHALMPSLDFAALPYWDLYAATRPAFKISEWAEDEAHERTMRQRLAWFVEGAFECLA
jgi:aminoglycoside phosphotransferase (APT) family kinase protein